MRDPKTDELVNAGEDYPVPALLGAKIDGDSKLEAASLLGAPQFAPPLGGAKIHSDSKIDTSSALYLSTRQPAPVKVEPASRAPKTARRARKKTGTAKRSGARKTAAAKRGGAARKAAGAVRTAGTGRSGANPMTDPSATSAAPVRPSSAPGQTEGTTAAQGSEPARQQTPGPAPRS